MDKTITKEEVISYLIDCFGYEYHDLPSNASKNELIALYNIDINELIQYCN